MIEHRESEPLVLAKALLDLIHKTSNTYPTYAWYKAQFELLLNHIICQERINHE